METSNSTLFYTIENQTMDRNAKMQTNCEHSIIIHKSEIIAFICYLIPDYRDEIQIRESKT